MIEAREYQADELLRDGGSIHIRAIRPEDRARLLEHFRALSPQSVYFRFFGPKRSLSDTELERLIAPDYSTHVALLATLRGGGDEKIIGVGRYLVREGSVPPRAELAFAVLDAYQGRGIATLLLEHLGRIARANGISEFEASVMGANRQMLEVFAGSGFRIRHSLDAGIVNVSFPTEESESYQRASHLRELNAAAHSIAGFIRPRSVAVVGASRREGSIGAALVANLRRARFNGPIYPINQSAGEIQGLRAYASVADVGAPVDLAVIALPAEAVEDAVRDCARAGVKGVVVISSGFAEISAEGRERERRLFELVRGSGMRMVGPNCMGVLNTDPAISLNATFAPNWPPPGNIGMLSQSGALGLAILDYARSRGIGLSTFVSAGNKADVSSNDMLAYWAQDPRTEVIVLYLESFGNPRKFARIAPEVARVKPIVAVKAGRSAAGTRAASSHSAALASLDVAVDALFEQAGVIRTNTLEELFDVVALLSSQPVPGGPRVGVVTNAGGPGIMLADACEARGLKLPELEPATVASLRSFLVDRAGLGNPIDMTAQAGPSEYQRTIAAVGADPNVDSLVVIYIPPMVTKPEEIAAAIAQAAGQVPAHKPVATVFISSGGAPAALHEGPRGRLATFSFPENAAMALSAAERYARWRQRPHATALSLDRSAQGAIRTVVDRVLAGVDTPAWLDPYDAELILNAAGIRYERAEQTTVESAPAAADRIGYPLVAKIISRDVLHKSDVGGVIMGLRSAADVAQAVHGLAAKMRDLGKQLDGILLQRQVDKGVEALVGVTSDPTFGPLLVCGLGGVAVELLRDVAFRLHPVTDVDAEAMLVSLRASKLLDGFRGSPRADRAALVSIITRISALAEVVPELRELDLNPVIVLPEGKGAVAVDARIRIGPLLTA